MVNDYYLSMNNSASDSVFVSVAKTVETILPDMTTVYVTVHQSCGFLFNTVIVLLVILSLHNYWNRE